MALELLCQYSDGKYYMSDFAKELFTQFDEVLVDEYQDVNDLQDTLFSLVSGYGEHLFAVGDVKQSIYGFRGANPANFVNKKDSYIPLQDAKEDDKKKIVLSSNFRSRKGVCGFVNYFCSLIMSRNLGGVDYNEEDDSYEILTTPDAHPAVENALKENGITLATSEVTMIPQNYVELTDETAIKNLQKTLDLLEDDDDVQAVYHNWDE